MGRKQILDLDSYKFTLNIHGDNKILLDILTEELDVKYGPAINMMISTFCNMPKEIKADFLDLCEFKIKEIEKIQKIAGILEYQKLQNQKEYYEQIKKFINIKKQENNSNVKENVMQIRKIELKNGYLAVPGDWILLNPEDAQNCEYAGVVECRNSDMYRIPHFVFFTQDFYKEDESHVNEMCVEAYPKFREIIEMQVKPIPDPEKKGRYLNEEEFLMAPIIGHFLIPEKEEVYKSKLKYPAMVIRNKLN